MKHAGGDVWTLDSDPKMVDACSVALEEYSDKSCIDGVVAAATET